MAIKAEPVDKRVKDAIVRILRARLAKFGFRGAEINGGYDHDGDAVLRIQIAYSPEGRPIDPAVVFALTGELRDRLGALGETRFPHIRHLLEDSRQIAS